MSKQRLLAWGAKVDEAFRARVLLMATRLGCDASHLMACMAFETGGQFSPSIRNFAGSGATGLIQFMPQTAAALGTSTEALSKMSAVDQLSVVESYFWPRRGKLKSLSDVYMAILWPAAVGKPEDFVLFDKRDARFPKRYVQNAGLDLDRNGKITKGEATEKVQLCLERGLRLHATTYFTN